MRKPILAPDLGWPNVVLSIWYVKPGETVYAGDRLVELMLGSATFDVTAEEAGTLVEQCAIPDESLTPNRIIGFVEVSDETQREQP